MWGRKKAEVAVNVPYSSMHDSGGTEPAFPSSSFPAASTLGLPEADRPTLRETLKKRLMNDMIKGFTSEVAGVVMCVDTFSVRILSSVCKMSELLEDNINIVENITMKQPNGIDYLRRQPLPELAALYFIQPTVESVNRLIADFRDKKKPMYRCCHLYFTSRVSDALFNKIKASAAIAKVAGFKELNLEFVCTEANSFVLDSPQSLPVLFAPEETPMQTEAKVQEQHRLASMISTLCVTLGEMPHVRHSTRPVAAEVAKILQSKLAELAAPGSSFPSRIQKDEEKPTLLVIDRSQDALSPLLHEFSYQAMAHDLLPIHEDKYTYHYVANNSEKNSKTVLLNDTDPLWTRLRHMHIADLGTLLHTEFKQFLADNPEAAALLSKGGDKDLKAMTAGLRGLPKFQETHARYSLHMALTQELMTKYNKFCLESIATLEQNMSVGEDSTGKAYTPKAALAEMRALLERSDIPFSPEDKMRLLMIYVSTQDGIKQDERRQLLQLAGISPEDQVAILNLFYLNVTLLQGTKDKKKPAAKKGSTAEASYDVSRYVPPLKRSVEDLCAGCGLSVADFPFVAPPEGIVAAAREAAAAVAKKSKEKGAGSVEVAATGKRLIVVVLGGMSYSEVRAMHEVARATGREIIIGTTAMLTPQAYLLGLKQMKQLDGQSKV